LSSTPHFSQPGKLLHESSDMCTPGLRLEGRGLRVEGQPVGARQPRSQSLWPCGHARRRCRHRSKPNWHTCTRPRPHLPWCRCVRWPNPGAGVKEAMLRGHRKASENVHGRIRRRARLLAARRTGFALPAAKAKAHHSRSRNQSHRDATAKVVINARSSQRRENDRRAYAAFFPSRSGSAQ
jgi:hypothetical protein